MSTKPVPRNSGAGLRELQWIQDERIAEAKPMCGDCRFFDELAGDDNRPCLVPLPFWVSPKSPCWPWRGDERAKDCQCFERKGAK